MNKTSPKKGGSNGNKALFESNERLKEYIRHKVNQLLTVMGTRPLNTEELDDDTLIELDPIGIIATSFEQVLDHLKETNKQLSAAKDQLQAVFDTAGVCISIVDPEMRIINCNEKQKELLVSDETDIIGRYCHEIYCGKDSPSIDCPAVETLSTGKPVFIREIKKKGRYFQIVTSPLKDPAGDVTGAIEVSIDVTEKKKAEESSRQAEKLAAIGLLAAGIAHEINNPLGNILGYAKVLSKEPALTPNQKEKLGIIAEQAKRGSDIIRGLLDFSSQSRPLFREVSINEVINDSLRLLSEKIKKQKIRVKTELGNIPMVSADQKQLEQVMSNLLMNAVHALDSRQKGLITIETEYKYNYVEVRVADNGHGIPNEDLPKIFDPFFTTKPVGKGVGLGLSISSGIIRDHNGSIRVESEEHKGTRFMFQLPAMSA